MYKISLLQTGIIWSQYKNKINNFKISWIFIICNFCEPSNALLLYIHWEKSYNSINGPFSCMRDPKAIPGLRFPVPADTQGRYTRPLLEVGGRSLLVAPAHSSLLPLRCSFLPAAPSFPSLLPPRSFLQSNRTHSIQIIRNLKKIVISSSLTKALRRDHRTYLPTNRWTDETSYTRL